MAPRKPGIAGVRGIWLDATAEIEHQAQLPADPHYSQKRGGVAAGQWPGAPSSDLPPDCPVMPLGVAGKITFVVDANGQMIDVAAGEWSKKMLVHLFGVHQNYLYWAWPRFAEKTHTVNGLETDEAIACIQRAASARGIFDPQNRVRGRGAWSTNPDRPLDGDLIWHAGDRIYRVEKGELKAADTGEIAGVFYPRGARTMVPWRTAVPIENSPVHDLLTALRSWNWERPVLDPLLVIGWIGCAFLGGALDWRPHLYTTGDKGVGKSTLHWLIQQLLKGTLLSTADTTAAGIYQSVRQDSLPVAIDELEATADNRRVMAVVSLARLASSGAIMHRGGADHAGVNFTLRNTFFMSGINPPPMEPADRSRLAMLNLGKLDPHAAKPPMIDADVTGRMILRGLMDGWPKLRHTLSFWKNALHGGGIDSRGQDTWGTLLAVASILLGDEALEEAGLPVTDERRLGALVAAETAGDRADAQDNWISCLHRLLGGRIDAWKGGEQPTVGSALEQWETGEISIKAVNERLQLAGLWAQERVITDDLAASDLDLAVRREEGEHKLYLLCVPTQRSPGLDRLFAGSKWADGVWGSALKQAPKNVVIRHWGNGQNVKINRQAMRCLLIDMKAYDRAMKADFGIDPAPHGGASELRLPTPAAADKGGRKAKWPAKE